MDISRAINKICSEVRHKTVEVEVDGDVFSFKGKDIELIRATLKEMKFLLQKKETLSFFSDKSKYIAEKRKEELQTAIDGEVVKSGALHSKLSKRKKSTIDSVVIPRYVYNINTGTWGWKAGTNIVPENRLFRILGLTEVVSQNKVSIITTDGKESEVTIEKKFYECQYEGKPLVVYCDFHGEANPDMDPIGYKLWKDSIKLITEGLYRDDAHYEYVFSSGSQQRTLKGVFVLSSYKYPEKYLKLFEDKEYHEFLSGLSGAEAILEAVTYGAWSHEFKDKEGSAAKVMARASTSLTATKDMGNEIRVRRIGSVITEFSDVIRENILNEFKELQKQKPGLFNNKRLDKIMDSIKSSWKKDKLDGQSIIRFSWLKKALQSKFNLNLEESSLMGRLLQARFAGLKGTLLVVDDWFFDLPELPDGSKPYANYDMVIEGASWKYSPSKFYKGELAPSLDSVRMSKSKFTSNMNYLYWNALDGNTDSRETIRELVDESFAIIKEVLDSPESALAKFGMYGMEEEGTFDIDSYEMSKVSKVTDFLDASHEITKDINWRKAVVNMFMKSAHDAAMGKILVKGANRYVISDPSALLRTDLAVFCKDEDGNQLYEENGEPLFDIVITHPNQLAIRGNRDAYWKGESGDAVLFRSPCVHPGEPQKVNLIGIDSIPEYLTTEYGEVPVKQLFNDIKHLIVINAFSMILDALGGADTDGDTLLCCTDPRIVAMRSPYRATLLNEGGSSIAKEVISKDSLKKYMSQSLKNSGTGIITNWATTWRDIGVTTVRGGELYTKNGIFYIPSEIQEAMLKVAKAANSLRLSLGSGIGALPEDEAKAINNIANLCNIIAKDSTTVSINDKRKDYNATWRKAVCDACDSALVLCRRLQERSLDTAKSGVFVDLGSYKFLNIKVRASWHKPYYYKKYQSDSFMAYVSSYSKECYEKIMDYAITTSGILDLPDKNGVIAKYPDVYRAIVGIRDGFNDEVSHIQNERNALRKEAKYDNTIAEYLDEKYYAMVQRYHSKLSVISAQIGNLYDATVMIYNASYQKVKDHNKSRFAWICWHQELADTLRYIEDGKESTRLIPVNINPDYETFEIGEGTYEVIDSQVYYGDIVIGTCGIEDGQHEVLKYGGRPYMEKAIIRQSLADMNTHLSNIHLNIIGFQYYSVCGHQLNRDLVVKIINNRFNNGTAMVRIGSFKRQLKDGTIIDEAAFQLVCKVADADNAWVPVGVIGDLDSGKTTSRLYSSALCNKLLKISIPDYAEEKDMRRDSEGNKTYKRLSILVESVIKDLN